MDDGDWICLQCGTYYYVDLYQRPESQNSGETEERRGREGAERATSFLANSQDMTLAIAFASALAAGAWVTK